VTELISTLEFYNQKKENIEWWEEQEFELEIQNKKLAPDDRMGLGEFIYNKLEFGIDGGPSANEIEIHYENLKDLGGTHGKLIKTISASPTRSYLISKAENQLNTGDAFAEFIDNIFDNYIINCATLKEIRGNADLNIQFRITNLDGGKDESENGELLIIENSGGVKKENWESLCRYGGSSEEESESIGTWGEGSKLALCALGRWNIFQTRHIYEPIKEGEQQTTPIQIMFGDKEPIDSTLEDKTQKEMERNYYHPDNDVWAVKVHEATHGHSVLEGNEGSTSITIRRLTRLALEELMSKTVYEQRIRKLAQIFKSKIAECEKLQDSKVSLVFMNEYFEEGNPLRLIKLEEFVYWDDDFEKVVLQGDFDLARKELFTFLPGFQPIRIKTRIRIEDEYVEVDALFGSTLQNKEGRVGLVLWGNGRLFDGSLDSSFLTEGFNSPQGGYSTWKVVPQWRRYLGLVKFKTSNSRLIPWKGPVKWGFNPKDKDNVSGLFQELVSSIMTRYIYLSGHLFLTDLVDSPVIGTNLLLEMFSHKEKNEIAPEKYPLDCTNKKTIQKGIVSIVKSINELDKNEVSEYIQHYFDEKVITHENFNYNSHYDLRKNAHHLASAKEILGWRHSKGNFTSDFEILRKLIPDERMLAFCFTPDSFIQFNNLPVVLEELNDSELENLCKKYDLPFDKDKKEIINQLKIIMEEEE
jgi:hypothetical protein